MHSLNTYTDVYYILSTVTVGIRLRLLLRTYTDFR